MKVLFIEEETWQICITIRIILNLTKKNNNNNKKLRIQEW